MSDESFDDAIVERVVERYLGSGDYNGLTIDQLINEVGATESEVVEAVARLVERGRLTLTSERTDVNPYIRRLPDASVDVQLDLLRSGEGGVICAYPAAGELDDRIGATDRVATPYSARLSAGGAQLQPVFFEPVVLDRYMRDPRYRVSFSTTAEASASGTRHTRMRPFLSGTRSRSRLLASATARTASGSSSSS